MPGADSISLNFGLSSWLRAAQLAAAALGAAAIALAPAGLFWKLGAWSALAFGARWAQTASIRRNRSGRLELEQDGTVRARFADGTAMHAVVKENAWAIRWFCVLVLFEPESGRNYHCVVCASENTPENYRRLLKFLNMRLPTAIPQKANRW